MSAGESEFSCAGSEPFFGWMCSYQHVSLVARNLSVLAFSMTMKASSFCTGIECICPVSNLYSGAAQCTAEN
jgi:hypothetical protein